MRLALPLPVVQPPRLVLLEEAVTKQVTGEAGLAHQAREDPEVETQVPADPLGDADQGEVAPVAMDLEVPPAAVREALVVVVEIQAVGLQVDLVQEEAEEIQAVVRREVRVAPNLKDTHQNSKFRRAFTLLELLLALTLAGVLLYAITLALSLHWKAFDVKRTNVEEAQLARALLRHMEDDIRSAVQSTPLDLSGLDGAMSGSVTAQAAAFTGSTGSAGAAGTGTPATPAAGGGTPAGSGTPAATSASPSAGGSAPGGAGGGATAFGTGASGAAGGGNATSGSPAGAAGAESEATTENTSEGTAVVVGLYGSATQIQFDVSRLPRVDQYEALGGELGAVDIPSDIKTVTYYVRNDPGAQETEQGSDDAASSEPSASGTGRGLMRLELDRAVTAWQEVNGSVGASQSGAKLLADEVVSIKFQYWDGSEWVADWNSDEMGGLPVAVEVTLTLASQEASSPQTSGSAASADSSEDQAAPAKEYRMVIHLPAAVGGAPTTESTEESGSESTDTSSTAAPVGGATP